MILYFTGTGNSKFVADFLSCKLNDETVSINEYLKCNRNIVCNSEKPYIIVAPIYAWRFPAAVEDALKNAEFNGCQTVYCVATMGENSGDTDKYLKKIFIDKGMNFAGFIGVPMQNNYLLMEAMPTKDKVLNKLNGILPKLNKIADIISSGGVLRKDDKTPCPAFMSSVINWGFSNFMLKNQKYNVNENCILCGKCVNICPVNNISIKENDIIFGTNCMACFACLHYCPNEAINIKGKTEDKGRYICPEYKEFSEKN